MSLKSIILNSIIEEVDGLTWFEEYCLQFKSTKIYGQIGIRHNRIYIAWTPNAQTPPEFLSINLADPCSINTIIDKYLTLIK